MARPQRSTPVSPANAASSRVAQVLERVNLISFKTHLINPTRDTGEGDKSDTRITKVLQRCFDPGVLRPFGKLKQAAQRACRSQGTRIDTLDAWAVPLDHTEQLLKVLESIASEWERLAKHLATSIGAAVEAYAAEHPSERDAIRTLAPSSATVRQHTRFQYAAFRLKGEDVVEAGGLTADVSGLAGQTLHELAAELRDAGLTQSGRSQYSTAITGVLERVASKAKSLHFVDPVIEQVAKVLDDLLVVLPRSGAIKGNHAVLVTAVIECLLNPNRLLVKGFQGVNPQEEIPASFSPPVATYVRTPAVADQMLEVAW